MPWNETFRDGKLVERVFVEEPRRAIGSFVEFMDLFTLDQQIAIEEASNKNAELRLLLRRATAANEIDLDSEAFRHATAAFVKSKAVTDEQIGFLIAKGF